MNFEYFEFPDISVDGGINSNQELLKQFLQTRSWTEEICDPLAIEDYVVQPTSEVSPPKWHLAHTTWFFEELILVKFDKSYQRFNDKYQYLFNSYYKAAGPHWTQAHRGQLSRPRVSEVYKYRDYVTQSISELLNSPIEEDLKFLLELGIHHEQQHQELLFMDLKYILGINHIPTTYSETALAPTLPVEESWSSICEGIYSIGNSEESFAYDNECPKHKKFLSSFSIRNNAVSNGEYLEFIGDGGYKNPKLWLSQGWDWVNHNDISKPLYWSKGDTYKEYTLYGEEELDLNKPVSHISYFEANAFANWTGYRLPLEEELEIYLKIQPSSGDTPDTLDRKPSNNSLRNLWWWSQSQYSAYPGYRRFDGFVEEYNGKFMCNQFVLKGGSFATPKAHYRHSYRNFYEPHQQWMFSGIKLAKDNS